MVTLPRFSATRFALCGIALSVLVACADPNAPPPIIQTQVTEISVPPAQEHCPRLPTPPDPDDPATTQRDIALYITELVSVAEHCRADLYTLNRIIREYNALAAEHNLEPIAEVEDE